MGEKALVFVSCGQVTDAEKKLGKDIIHLIDGVPGLQGYFADTVSSLDGLSTNIFKNLERASAFVTVMHHRGVVRGRKGSSDRVRASVWIEQEIAIASFLQQTRSFDLKVAAYAQRGLHREGLRDKLILNTIEFDTESEILPDLASKLTSWNLKPRRSDEPSLDVSLERVDENITGERHDYGLRMKLTNTSALSIPEVAYELEFPSAFLPPNREFHAHEERRDQATDTHRVFWGKHSVDLRPGKTTSIRILGYYVTHDLYWKHSSKMEQIPVKLDVYADKKIIGSTTRSFKELENF